MHKEANPVCEYKGDQELGDRKVVPQRDVKEGCAIRAKGQTSCLGEMKEYCKRRILPCGPAPGVTRQRGGGREGRIKSKKNV